MGKSYSHVAPIAQPDRTACWSSSMAWWTKTRRNVKDYEEVEIMGMYNHLKGDDGGLKFPDGYISMLKDPRWGLTIETSTLGIYGQDLSKTLFKKAPVMCGFWDWTVGGYHSVALHNFEHGGGVWAMDPNGGVHVFQTLDHFITPFKKTIFGYIA